MASKINQNTVESIQFTLKKLVDSFNLEKEILENLEHEIENSDLPNFNHEELTKYGLNSELGIKLFFLGIYNLFIYGSMRESTSPDIVRFTIRKFTWYRSLFSFLKNFTAKQVDDLFSLIKVPSNIGKELVVKSPPQENNDSLKSILHPTVWDNIEQENKKEEIIEVKENDTVNEFRNETKSIADNIFNQYMAIDGLVIPENKSFFRNKFRYRPIFTKHTEHYATNGSTYEYEASSGRKEVKFSEDNMLFTTDNICGAPTNKHMFSDINKLNILDTPFCSDMESEEWQHFVQQIKFKTNLRIDDVEKLYTVLDKVDKSEMFTVNDWTFGLEIESKKNLIYAATVNGVEDLVLRRAWSFTSSKQAISDMSYEDNLRNLKEEKPELYKITVEKLKYRNWLFTGYPLGLDENPENKMLNNLRKYEDRLMPSSINPLFQDPIYNYTGLAYSWENKNDKLTYYNGLGTYGFHSLLDKKEDNRSISDRLFAIKDINKSRIDRESNKIDKESGYNHPHYHVLKELLMMLTPYDGENTYNLVKDYAKKLDKKQISIEDFMEICLQRKIYNAFKSMRFNDEDRLKTYVLNAHKMPVTGSVDSIPAMDYINRVQSEKGNILPGTLGLKVEKLLNYMLDQDMKDKYEKKLQAPFEEISELKLDYKLANDIRNQNLHKLNEITTLAPAS